MERERGLPNLELWKAQLAYVSGTILAWGAVLLQCWPVLARLQTGAHVHALGRDENVWVPATSYYLLALLVAVGLGMLVFGTGHIVARGFWFARLSIPRRSPTTSSASDRVARSTYIVLHVFWATALLFLCVVPLFALSALITKAFTAGFAWSVTVGRVAAAILVFALPLAVGVMIYRHRIAGGRAWLSDAAQRVGRGNLVTASVALSVFWLAVLEFSYVADVRLERHVFSRATEPTVVASVELGGAVSDPAPAQLVLNSLAGDAKRPDTLHLRRVHNGLYVSVIPTKSLSNGDYVIEMTYPHGALSPVFPFFRDRIRRSVGFVVVD